MTESYQTINARGYHDTRSREWLELMYNNRARVSNSEEYIKRWATSSALTRNDLSDKKSTELNIQYGNGVEETLDIFLPPDRTPGKNHPVFVFIHGGYWSALNKNDFSFIASSLTARGICVVVVNYTLCPITTVPAIVDEITRALVWINKNINNYGGDPDRVTISGHSAGGHLSAMMFNVDWQHYLPECKNLPFRNALSISGLFDLAPIRFTPFLQLLALTEEHVKQASPVLLPKPESGELYCVVGANESDEFLRQNNLLTEYWSHKRVPVCEALPGLDHFSIVDAITEPTARLHLLIMRLLEQPLMQQE